MANCMENVKGRTCRNRKAPNSDYCYRHQAAPTVFLTGADALRPKVGRPAVELPRDAERGVRKAEQHTARATAMLGNPSDRNCISSLETVRALFQAAAREVDWAIEAARKAEVPA